MKFSNIPVGKSFVHPQTNEQFIKLDSDRAFCLQAAEALDEDQNTVIQFVGDDLTLDY